MLKVELPGRRKRGRAQRSSMDVVKEDAGDRARRRGVISKGCSLKLFPPSGVNLSNTVQSLRNRGNRKGQGSLNEPIEGLPELIAACNGKESVFSAMVAQELHSSQTAQAWSFLSHLPVLEVEMSMKGWWEESQEQTEHPIPAAGANLRKESSWLDVHADQEYVLQVSLRRLNLGQQRRRQDSKAQAPRFPKAKDEGWFLVLGEVDRRELLAVKRVGYVRNHTAVSMAFYTPEKTGKCIYTLYLISDSYLGLDQQYDVHLNVTPASIAAQVNSEVSHSVSDLSLG